MTLAVYYFIRGYFNGRPAYYVWFYVAAALATLTKGPIGILLPGGAIFLFLVIQREWRQVIRVFFNWGLLLFAIIVSPWYIIETIKFGPAFLLENFGYHQFTRFAKGAETHAEPWYYNFVSLFLGFLPWSTFVPAGMLFAARKIKQKPILLVVLWAAVIFVFFTVSVSKLPGYLLPAFVPLSILVAVMAAAFLKNEGGITWKGMLFSFLFLAALLLALAVMFFYVVAAKGPAVVGGYGEAIKSLRPFAYLLGGGALVGLAAFLLKPKKTYFFWLLVIWVAALNIYFMYNVIPLIESFRPMKALGEKIAATAALSDRVASYNYYSRALMFYSRRNPDVVQNEKELAAYLSAPGKAYVAMYDTEYEQVKKVIGKNARVTRVIYRANHGALITND
jgi:4-amino-4-deoxy-L-arabinose transferase-like glycosyltransferase